MKNPTPFLRHPDFCTREAAAVFHAFNNRDSTKILSLILPLKNFDDCGILSQKLYDLRFRILMRFKEKNFLLPITHQISPELKESYLVEYSDLYNPGTYLDVENALIHFSKNPQAATPYLCKTNHHLCNEQLAQTISYYSYVNLSLNEKIVTLEKTKKPTLEKIHFKFLQDYPEYVSQLPGIEMYETNWPIPAYYTYKSQINLETLKLHFPKPFPLPPECTTYLPEEMVYALMRQESLFNPKIKSPAGALGLLQVMRFNAPKSANLFDPQENLIYGCNYLNKLFNQYKNPFLMAAAYNAGGKFIKRINQEKKLFESKEENFILWVESIPWKETRTYVKTFFRNYHSYFLLKHKTVKFSNRCLKIQQSNISDFLPTPL